MDSVFLTASTLPRLSLLVLALAMLVYFAVRPNQARGTVWFVASLAGMVVHHAAFVGLDVVYAAWDRAVFLPLTWVGGLLALWAWLGVSYRFLGDAFPRESRIVLSVAGLAAVLFSLLLMAWYAPSVRLEVSAPIGASVLLIGLGVWSGVVLARRGWQSGSATPRDAMARRAFRALAGVIGIALVLPLAGLLRDAEALSPVAAEQISLVGWAVAMLSIITVYANYVPEPTSVLVKVVGFAFLTVVTALGVGSVLAFPTPLPSGSFASAEAWLGAEQARAFPFALLILAAGGLVLVAFPLYLREGLTRPLHRLVDGVQRAARGHLDADVPVGARDEIGRLTEDFNRMTGSLRLAEDSLRRYADELEARVEARTAELAASLDALRAAQARLIQSEKMASLGQLTAGIAHEIKNPLNFVTNFAGLSQELVGELATETDPGERQAILDDLRNNAAKIETHGRRADAIVRAMMEHARSGTGERRTVDLNALVKEHAALALDALRSRQPETTVTLDLQLDADVGTVELAPQEIGRVLLNLLGNAFDAVGPVSDHAPAVRVSTERGGSEVRVCVSDSGIGMPPDVAAKVFEPFFTTKPAGEGTGLGLSLSHDIVVQGHGGRLEVDSEEGAGATFTLALPLAP